MTVKSSYILLVKALPWFKKAVKIAISIGQDADDDVLEDFTGNKELILQANNAAALAKMIKWASTRPALQPLRARGLRERVAAI